MEVPGKITEDTKPNLQLYCLPCDQDGLKAPAHGYCQDCQEHLCKTCFEHHTRPKPSRNHILLDKDGMPMQPITVDINVDPITDTCTKHRDKQLDIFCNNHEVVVCYVCATLEHKQCKVDYIPDVSGSVADEFKKLSTNMEELIKKFESNIRRAEAATKRIDQSHGKVVEEIKLFRKEINAYLNQMESVMIQEAENLTTTAKLKLNNVQVVCGEIAEEVKRSHSVLNALNEENKQNKLFIEMKNVRSVMTTLDDKGKRAIEDNKTDDDIKFVRNENILKELKVAKHLGTTVTYEARTADKELEIQYEKSYNVTFPSEKRCNIVRMAIISEARMVVADDNNKTIKMINADTGELVSKITLFSAPYDVIKLPDNKLAVAIPNERCIQMVSYNNVTLTFDRRIDVGEECKCVAYGQGKLVVGCGCSPGKLVILDITGNITQEFDTIGLFDSPEKIVISSDEKFMYVSNYKDTHAVKCIKMNWQGTVVQMFGDQTHVFPKGIQELEDGTLLVCFSKNEHIERLTSTFKKCKVVGLEKADLYFPNAVTYSDKDHRLFISSSSSSSSFCHIRNNTIKVFNVRWN